MIESDFKLSWRVCTRTRAPKTSEAGEYCFKLKINNCKKCTDIMSS